MPLSINTNIASMTAQRSFINSNASLEQSFERLSTGKRVNSAVDDAAGLAIGKDLESRVSGLNQAIRNVNDGISMVQIAEGSLDEVTSILQRMRDLAVQAANGSLSSTEQQYLDDEMDKLQSSIDDVVNQAKFSDLDLIDSNGQSFTIQSGADASDTMTISTAAMSSTILKVLDADIDLTGSTSTAADDTTIDTTNGSGTALAVTTASKVFTLSVDGAEYSFTQPSSSATIDTAIAGLNAVLTAANVDITLTKNGSDADQIDVSTTVGQMGVITLSDGTTTVTGTAGSSKGIDNANSAIGTIDRALATVAAERAALGATQSQLESTVRNLSNVAENTSAAAGRIMDTDYAAETANLTKAQILQQAATSILAQANAQPQAVLSLLQ
jgi:flagellin